MSTDTDTHSPQQAATEQVFDRVDEAVYALDTEWQFTFVTKQAASLFNNTVEGLLGERIWDVLPELQDSAAHEQFHTALDSQEPVRFEMHDEARDAWFTIRAYPSSDGLTVCFYDVTDERGQQLELQRKRRLFEAVFEDTEDALVIADPDRQITEFNPAAERLFGYDPAAVLGEKSRILYADDDDYEKQGDERYNRHAAERHDSYVVEYERADGTTFEGETVGTALEGPDGETLAYLAAIRDVSARLEYEETITRRNEALRSFHDITTDESRAVEERIDEVLSLGADYLGLDSGILAETDETTDSVEHVVTPNGTIDPGATFDIESTLAERVVDRIETISFTSGADSDARAHPASDQQGPAAYLGVPVRVDGACYGTLHFSSPEPRAQPFSEGERTFVRILAQWVGKEISRQQSRERAQASSERLRQVIDMLPQLVFAKDEGGEFLLANEAVAAAYGTTVGDLEGSVDADFADSEAEAEQFREDDRAVIASGEPKHIPQEPLTTADGEELILETTKIPYDPVETDGDAVLGVATDITDRKARERELERTKEFIEKAQENASIGGWEIELETETLRWTDEVYRIHDLPLDANVTLAEGLDFYHPDDRDRIGAAFERLRTEGESYDLELRIVTAADEVRWVRTIGDPLFDDEGTIVGARGIFMDIADRKQNEQDLKKRVEIEHTVAEITSQYAGDADFDAVTDEALAEVGQLLGAGRAYLFLFHDDGTQMDNTHEWCADGIAPQQEQLQGLPVDTFPWWLSKLRDGETIHIENVADLPEAAAAEKQILSEQDITSVLVLPVYVDDTLSGFVGFDNIGEIREWRKDALFTLRVISVAIGNSLEAKRAAKALRERDAELRTQSAAMEASMDGIAILDGDEYIYMNEAHADVFDFGPEELLGSSWRRLYGDEEVQRLESEVFPELQESGEWRGETLGQKRDGTPVHQELTLSLVDDGKLICTNRDITERKRRERELEQYEALVESMSETAFVVDSRGCLEYANEASLSYTDVSLDDIRGRSITTLAAEMTLDAEDISAFEEALDTALAGEAVSDRVELKLDLLTGQYVMEYLFAPFVSDGDHKAAVVARDITERKFREHELELQQTRLRALFDNSPDSIVVHDADGTVVDVNETQLRVLGYDEGELVGTNVAEFEVAYSRSELQDRWEEMEAGDTLKLEGKHRRQNGSIFPVEVWVDRVTVHGQERFIALSRDISERKQRERELQSIRQRFERFASAVPNGFFLVSPDYEETHYMNDATEELYGVSMSRVESDPSEWTTHIHPEDVDRLRADVEAQQNGTVEWPVTQEFRIQHPEGGRRWVQARVHPVRDDGGAVVELAGVATDITERKQLEQSLRTSEQSLRELTAIAADTDRSFETKLRDVLDLGCERLDLPYGFLNRIDDDEQHVVDAVGGHPKLQPGESAPLSRSYCRRTLDHDGVYTVDDAVGDGWDDDPAYETYGLGCYAGKTVEVNGKHYGTLCFAGDDGRDVEFDPAERAFVNLLVQWVSYELTSRAFETKLRGLNETAQQLMRAASPDEIATIATESADAVLDFPVTGVWTHDEGVLVPESMTETATELLDEQPTFERGKALAWDAFEDGEVHVYDDLQSVDGVHNDDTHLQSEAIVPLGDHGVLCTGATERHAFSEMDRSLLDIFAATVEAALTRAQREQLLRDTRQRLEQSNEELEQFAYAASHDLQEPLRTVSSYLTLLERRFGENIDAEALEFVDLAVDGADRMREMIQALLAYSRVDTKGSAFEPTPLGDVFDTVRQNLDVTIRETGATVTMPDTAGTVVGDGTQLVQLFQNLVENAIKYSDGQPQVAVTIERRDDRVAVAVTDDGIGMSPDQLDEIFEVFQRLHTREEFEGTGIGLSLCRKIVDRHDGDIRVDSTPGEGSTFTVTLPRGGPQ